MLTDLHERKFTKLFTLHDTNKDGVLEQSDYEQIAQGIVAIRGWDPGAPEATELRARIMRFWDGVKSKADESGDGRVTIKEFLAYMDQLLTTSGEFSSVMSPIATMVWQTMDRDRDGSVTADDYAQVYIMRGQDPALAKENFAHIDLDGDGVLSLDELMVMIEQFYKTDDPQHPANWLLGQA